MQVIKSLIERCSESDRRDIFAVACRVAFMDGNVQPERLLLQQIARELALSKNVTKRIEQLGSRNRHRRLPSIKDPDARRLALHFGLAVASSEERVSLRKRKLLNKLAAQLGRAPTEIDELVTRYRGKESGELLPPTAVPTRGLRGPSLGPPISPEEWQRLAPTPRRVALTVLGRLFLSD